jgi:transposase-like protein
MAAPARQRWFVERYRIVKRALRVLAKRYGINPKTLAKWKKRSLVADRPERTEVDGTDD